MKSKSILIWVVVILAVLNATTIATILYRHYNDKELNNDTVIINANGEMINGRYMRQQLGFDNSQIAKFRNLNYEFRQRAFTTIAAINTLKLEMFDELKKQKADSSRIKSIADSIGIMHADLKKRTADFYLTVKGMCNAEQVLKLESAFTPLFNNEGPGNGRGQSFQSGGGGHGRGQGWRRFNDSIN